MEAELRPAVMAAINRQQSLLYLTLILGREIFSWDGLEVEDIVSCDTMTEMSGMPPFICGGVSWNGEAVPVVDLQARMTHKSSPVTKYTRVVIVQMVQSGIRQLLGILMNPMAAARDGVRRVTETRETPGLSRKRVPPRAKQRLVPLPAIAGSIAACAAPRNCAAVE